MTIFGPPFGNTRYRACAALAPIWPAGKCVRPVDHDGQHIDTLGRVWDRTEAPA